MVGARKRGEAIRRFILDNVEQHPGDVAALTAQTFGISRQAVNRHLHQLVTDNVLEMEGATRKRRYALRPLVVWQHAYPLRADLAEDVVWRNDVRPFVASLPPNVVEIWHHSFTEMFNNAIEHSSGHQVTVRVTQTATSTHMLIYDDGEGIFKKIQRELGLEDERHAIVELTKGKLTTDPAHHSGEGIFFTSRMFDYFSILSGNVMFSHLHDTEPEAAEDWIFEQQAFTAGTAVSMKLRNVTARTTKEVFDRFTSGEEYGFTKTVVPVYLAQYGDDTLVSRSQAKRLLARIDRFTTVIFDFERVDTIGQAFADEIFRVFSNEHPDIELVPRKMKGDVYQMIRRVASEHVQAYLEQAKPLEA